MSVLPPRRRRRMAFMLTPLVDVMFLLLIFFMVSSQTAPYALLTVSEPQPPAAADQPPTPQPVTPTPAATKNQVLVSISNGYVRFNGSRVEAAGLDATIARFMAQGATSAMIMTTAGAKVQDVVSVIQAFQDAHFPSTQLMMEVASQ